MGDYNSYARNVLNTPHPIYGKLPPGFSVGDLPSDVGQAGLTVFTAVTGAQTSGLIDIGANAIELDAVFSDGVTTCDIQVQLADSTVFCTFTGVNNSNSSGLYAGFAKQRARLGGGSLKFVLLNYFGSGTLTLHVKRTG